MNIVVISGTGLIGSKTVALLRQSFNIVPSCRLRGEPKSP